jgi:ribonucleoside-diphosphate reductase alpha chain
MNEYGPQTKAGQAIFTQKYAQPGETYRDAVQRVAATLCVEPGHYKAFRQVMLDMRFLPGGRNLASLGTTKNVCSQNCFVSGIIEDSYVDGVGSIMGRATEAAATMRMGGGIGYDFSTLRPRGSLIKRLASNATGPVSFMEIFNAVGLNTSSSGHRRGAQMGVLRVDHPDIEEFIHAKQNGTSLTGFNISVGITDEFMHAVAANAEFPLRFNGEVHRTVNAGALWETIMRSAWDWAEPGVLFLDTINAQNNLAYCETITATNPCGEQPLPPFGACLLGSFNLVKYLHPQALGLTHRGMPFTPYTFDMEQFRMDIRTVVRAMDRVNDVALYPLQKQKDEALDKRRMGLGVMGLANAIEAIGYPYGSDDFIRWTHLILHRLADDAYRASAELARELGAFPMFQRDEYLASPFLQRLSATTQDAIAEHGIRNSHLVSFAPTGTIAQMADNVSGGIEPTFERSYIRPVIFPHGTEELLVEDYAVRAFGANPRVAADVTASEHVDVLCAAQRWSDSGVSKTCNVDGRMAWSAFKQIYVDAWQGGAKGCAVFNKDGKRFGLLRTIDPRSGAAEQADPTCISGVCGL